MPPGLAPRVWVRSHGPDKPKLPHTSPAPKGRGLKGYPDFIMPVMLEIVSARFDNRFLACVPAGSHIVNCHGRYIGVARKGQHYVERFDFEKSYQSTEGEYVLFLTQDTCWLDNTCYFEDSRRCTRAKYGAVLPMNPATVSQKVLW